MPYFNYKEYQIFYLLEGSGKPFVLLNGIMMSTKSWTPFINSFTASNTLLLLDFLDQGASSKATTPYTQDTQAEILYELLKHLNISSISVVGISYGGEVALHFTINYPHMVDRMLLFNTTAATSPWLKDIGEGWILTGKTRNASAYYKQTIPVIYSPSFYQSRLDWMKKREKILEPIFSNPIFLDAMERLTISAETHDVRNKLSLITQDTLIVTCGEDYLTPTPEQDYLRKNIKNSHYLCIPNSGHASMYEVPFIFSSLVLGFINNTVSKYEI